LAAALQDVAAASYLDEGAWVGQWSFDYLTVLHRLMVSGSDRHASSWQQAFKIVGAEELTLDHAYKAMAWEDVGEGRTNTEAIEEALYRYRRPLFGQVSVAFYDTTTLWFEGRGGAHLGRRGHSKDYRPHLAQVALGIVLDETDRHFALDFVSQQSMHGGHGRRA
jgi:hypothetical protein